MTDYLVYVGTYTDGKSRGIYAWRFSGDTGGLTPIGLVAETVNPSFLAVHPNRRFLYAVGEVSRFEGQATGLLSAYSINPKTGGLTDLNSVLSRGTGPCHVAVDHTGQVAIAANYGGGSVTAVRILGDGRLREATGSLRTSGSGVNLPRQSGPHPHGAFLSSDNRFVVVPDLGLDKLFVYRLDPDRGTLEPSDPPFVNLRAGAGPRHFAFHPSSRYGCSINEIDSTVTAFRYDKSRGILRPSATVSTLPPDFRGGNAASGIEIDPAGKFLYVSNRGADNIAAFAIEARGSLRLVEHVPAHGKTPRHFAIDPTGSWLLVANQDAGNVVVFRRSSVTGRLTPTGQSIAVGAPACLAFVPAG